MVESLFICTQRLFEKFKITIGFDTTDDDGFETLVEAQFDMNRELTITRASRHGKAKVLYRLEVQM